MLTFPVMKYLSTRKTRTRTSSIQRSVLADLLHPLELPLERRFNPPKSSLQDLQIRDHINAHKLALRFKASQLLPDQSHHSSQWHQHHLAAQQEFSQTWLRKQRLLEEQQLAMRLQQRRRRPRRSKPKK